MFQRHLENLFVSLEILARRLRSYILILRGARIESKAQIGRRVRIDRPWAVQMGSRAQIESDVWFKVVSDTASIKIGRHVFFGKGVELDIKEKIEIYCATGEYPTPPNHPTNTCDPFTGNWFEHLMDPYELAACLNSTRFTTIVRCGFYDQPINRLKRVIKMLLNMAINTMGRHGLYLAPYFALSAKK